MEDRVVVRCVAGEAKLTISFVLDGSHRHMLRDQTEELGKVLLRIANNAARGGGQGGRAKKSKKSKAPQAAAEPVVVKLLYNGEAVSEDAENCEAWQDGTTLHIGEMRYEVQRNGPSFTRAQLPGCLMAGFPVCPRLEVEFGRLEDCELTWYKREDTIRYAERAKLSILNYHTNYIILFSKLYCAILLYTSTLFYLLY